MSKKKKPVNVTGFFYASRVPLGRPCPGSA